jgi:non-ribosomal peptide synthetase component F
MLGHLERVLEQVAADADVHLSRLELLSAEEREQVLGTWNHTERGTSDPPVHELFTAWARRAPEAVALLDGREAVTCLKRIKEIMEAPARLLLEV